MKHVSRTRHLKLVVACLLGVGFEILRRRNIAFLFQLVQKFFKLWQFFHAPGRDIQNGFVAERLAFLREMADHRPFIALNRAGVRLALLEDEREQRGLARAVRADKRDAFAVIHLERRVFKQRAPAKSHFQIAND